NQWYTDSSGSGNHLSTWGSTSRPTATNGVPFSTVPQTGATNGLALDFDRSDDLGTFGAQTLGKMIEPYAFTNGWTVECSFKTRDYSWAVVVGKDGRRSDAVPGAQEGLASPFGVKLCGDPNWREYKRIGVNFVDGAGYDRWVWSLVPVVLGNWYDLAVTCDNSIVSLYLREEGQADYVLQDYCPVAGGTSFDLWEKPWMVGRGMYNNGATDWFNGLIDEVRISNVALDPAKFLQAPGDFSEPPAEPGPTCNLDGGQLSWNSTNDAFYAVEYSTNLISNDWRTVTNGIAATPDTNSVPLPPSDQDSEFYRVLQSSAVWPIPEKTVVLTFDDAVQSHLDFVAPLLTNHGFNATFFVTEAWMNDTANFMTWEDIGEIHQMGFEIGNHSRNHGLPWLAEFDFSQAASTNQLRDELAYVEAQLANVGVSNLVSFGWPNNNFGPEAQQVLKEEGYKFARRGAQPEEPYGHIRMGPLYDPMEHDLLLIPTTADAYPDWTLEHFKTVMAQAESGKVVILQFHGVPDVAHPWVHCDPVLFEQCMDYLADQDFNVIALRDLEPYIDPDFETHDPTLQKRYPYDL
ncbi:MAG: hypothetical protein DRP64_10285, partial [Verrucomicrobia bacterium]